MAENQQQTLKCELYLNDKSVYGESTDQADACSCYNENDCSNASESSEATPTESTPSVSTTTQATPGRDNL